MDLGRQRAMFKLILDILRQDRTIAVFHSRQLYQKIVETSSDISQSEMQIELQLLESNRIIKISNAVDSDGHAVITFMNPSLLNYLDFD